MIRSHGEGNWINVRNFENALKWSAKSYLHLNITAFQYNSDPLRANFRGRLSKILHTYNAYICNLKRNKCRRSNMFIKRKFAGITYAIKI